MSANRTKGIAAYPRRAMRRTYSRGSGAACPLEGYRQTDPRAFRGRARREYSSPGGEADDEWFVDNLIGTINIGASLEDATWDLALRILPQQWWDRRTAELAAAALTRRPIPAAEC